LRQVDSLQASNPRALPDVLAQRHRTSAEYNIRSNNQEQNIQSWSWNCVSADQVRPRCCLSSYKATLKAREALDMLSYPKTSLFYACILLSPSVRVALPSIFIKCRNRCSEKMKRAFAVVLQLSSASVPF